MKTCSKCKITKEFNEFQKDKSKLDGYRYHCKACKKALSKSHTITHLHQGAKYSKEWKAKYPEKAIAQKAKRRAAKLQRTYLFSCRSYHTVTRYYCIWPTCRE
jgi:predicted NAD/FAD-dependent oxidoreductase